MTSLSEADNVPRRPPTPRSPVAFLVLTQLLTVPLLLAGPMLERRWGVRLPANLPATALMTFCPGAAALLLLRLREGRGAAGKLLKRAVDFPGFSPHIWWVPVLGLMPLIMALSDATERARGVALPDWEWDAVALSSSLALFLVGAVGEEVGWQGYAMGPLQHRWGALRAALLLGLAWGLWHVVPFRMMGRPWGWIVAQVAFSVAARVLLVWMGNHTHQSVLGAVVFHALINTLYDASPGHGAFYNPVVTAAWTAVVAGVVLLLWDGPTLTRLRWSKVP
jgi:membrane protease YdiL (CAAX protease family)